MRLSRVATETVAASLLGLALPAAIGIAVCPAANAQTGPTITSQPTSQTVTVGNTATFSVTATGTSPLTYVWQYLSGTTWKPFGAGTGYTTATLTTVATTAVFNGLQFRVVVTDGNSLSTTSNTVTLTVHSPPVISSQPTSQTVTAGNSATFSVTATGAPTLTYVWQYLSGTTWKPFGAGTGYTTATLTTVATTAVFNGLQFRVVVTDGNGLSTTSNTVTLTVHSPPVITVQPTSQTVNAGSTATFSVTATGTPTLTYVWQYLSGTTWKAFGAGTGYTTATLTTVATTAAFNGLQFRVVVTDGNSLSTTSNTVTLTVHSPPVITSQPASQTVTVGNTATFSVTATGAPTLTYVWQYLSGTTWKAFGAGTGYTTATLTTVATTAAFNGLQFRVVVTDGNGLSTTSNTVTLTVNSPPVITAQPTNQTVNVGSTATFSVTATGTPTLTYAWQYLSGTTWKAFGAGTGYNTATLTTVATTAAFNGLQFRVVVTAGNGLSTTSNVVTLTVDQLLALPSPNPASLPTAIVDRAYAGTITATGGSGSGYVFTVVGLPSDSLQNALNNGSSTLTIGGTPTTVTAAATPVSFQVSVRDSLGDSTGPVTYTIAVVPPAPLVLQAGGSLPAATTNVAYSGGISASGGSGSGYVFAVNGTSIPTTGTKVLIADSISVSSTGTGTLSISGTPTLTQEVALTNVTVKDNAGDTAGPNSYSIAVNPPSQLTLEASTSLPGATAGVAYGAAISASGGSGSGYVFAVNGTPIPTTGALVAISDGISVSSTGGNTLSVSGTPTTGGTVNLTNVTVKDSAGDTAGPDTYTIAVTAPTYSVSGQIFLNTNCGSSGGNLPTFTVSINTSPVQTTTTDSSGSYSFASIPNGTYTITPSITGASSVFYPVTQTGVVVNNSGVSGENFSASVGYTVSGTVSYSGTVTGPIYVELYNNNCGGGAANGTTITAPGSFTIRGVAPGTYTLNSWRDNLGFGQPNASNPVGSVSNVTVSNISLTGVSVALADPGAVTLSTAPTVGSIDGFTNGVFINFKPILNNNSIELPTSYTVQWSTTTSFTSPAGSHSFAAIGDNTDVWFLNSANVTGLTSGDSYYFRVQGVAGTSTSGWSSTVGPIKLAEATAANTVTGTVTFTGTATGPLYVGFYDNSTGQAWAAQVGGKTTPPTSPASYSVEVPSGTFGFFAITDQNNDGLIDPGDLTNTNTGNGPPNVTISGNTTESVTLPSANSTVNVTTRYSQYTSAGISSSNYNLNFDVREGIKLPIAATLASGPNVIDPVDMGACGSNCGTPQFQYNAWTSVNVPKVGDSYSFKVTYSDGTTGTLTGTVTAVLGASALPALVSPTGSDVGFTPSFDWTYPTNAGNYTYQFYLCCGPNGDVWNIPGNNSNSKGFTNSQITPPLVWGVDPTNSNNTPSPSSLSAGTYYSWSLQAQDINGNSAQAQMSFETAPGPVGLPAANTNPLPSGLVDVPYSGALNASGGAGGGNYYFKVNGTTIPTNNTYTTATNSDGLTFANSGGNTLFVGGTPTSTESALALTIEVFDTTNSSDTATVTYTVVIGTPTPVSLPTASSNPLGSPVVGYPFGGTINASGGAGGGNYYFKVNGTTIPTNMTYVSASNSDGLTFANSSGSTLWVAGTPTTAGPVSLDVEVFDTTNASDNASVTYPVTVGSAPTGANNGNAKGTYVCKTNGYVDSNGAAWASLSSVVLDGNGNITSGIFDNNGTGYPNAVSGTITGTYSIGADNNGLVTSTSVATSGSTGTSTQKWVLALTNAGEPANPAQEFRLVEADDLGPTPSGQTSTVNCYLATTSAFAVSTISAKGFAFGLQGENSSQILKEHVGRLTASAATGSGSTATGTITSGYLDGMRLDQTGDNGGAFTGSYTGPNSNGRFTMTITPTSGTGSATLAAYIIDANRMFLLETAGDTGVTSGEMRTQQQASYSNSNLSGAAVLFGQGLEYSNSSVSGADSQIYQVSGNGAGTLTMNQSYDDHSGTYAVGAENGDALAVTLDSANPGRASFSTGASSSAFLYFYNTNSAFYLELNGSGSPSELKAGWLQPQTQTTFTDAALAGTYLLSNLKLGSGDSSVGEADVASNGTAAASVSTGGQNSFSFDSAQTGLSYTWLTATYGAFSLVETGQSGGETCMVITSPNVICMDGTSSSAKMSILQK